MGIEYSIDVLRRSLLVSLLVAGLLLPATVAAGDREGRSTEATPSSAVLQSLTENERAQEAHADSSAAYTAVVLQDFPPLYQTDDENNPAGYAIDVLKQVATRAGFTVTYIVVDNWTDAADAVRSGRADFVPAYGVTPGTEEDFTCSSVLETVPVSVFVRDGDTTIRGVDTLAGRMRGPPFILRYPTIPYQDVPHGRYRGPRGHPQ